MARTLTRRHALFGLALAAAAAAGRGANAQATQEADPWPELQRLFFGGKPIVEDPAIVSLEAPARAEDAALVPMSFSARLPPGDPRRVTKLTLVIDNNPVPLAAAFTFSDKTGDTRIATRVRVELLHQRPYGGRTQRRVAAHGDPLCEGRRGLLRADGQEHGPSARDLGQMKFRILPPTADAPNEALIMIRHPNNSGLQMDQVTRLYTPARYIDKLAVYQGDELVFSMAAGISIAEDPNFRFTFKPNGARKFRVQAQDTTGEDLFRRLAGQPLAKRANHECRANPHPALRHSPEAKRNPLSRARGPG